MNIFDILCKKSEYNMAFPNKDLSDEKIFDYHVNYFFQILDKFEDSIDKNILINDDPKIIECLISIITRAPRSETSVILNNNSYNNSYIYSEALTKHEFLQNNKRSYHIMDFIVNSQDETFDIIFKNSKIILHEIFRGFYPYTYMNFYHASVLIDYFANINSLIVLPFLERSGYLKLLIEYSHIEPVSECCIRVILKIINESDLRKETFIRMLDIQHILQILLKKIIDTEKESCLQVFLYLFTFLCSHPSGTILLEKLSYESELFQKLLINILNFSTRNNICLETFMILLKYSKKYLQRNSHDLEMKLLMNIRLRNFYKNMATYYQQSYPLILKYFQKSRHLYSVSGNLFILAEIIEELIDTSQLSGIFISDICCTRLWNIFIRLFFRCSRNDIYHSLFCKIIFTILRNYSEPKIINNFLIKSRLIPKLINSYTNNILPKGRILYILNIIRLHGDSERLYSLLGKYLRHSQEWRKFLPILMEETIFQEYGYRNIISDNLCINIKDICLESVYAKKLGFTSSEFFLKFSKKEKRMMRDVEKNICARISPLVRKIIKEDVIVIPLIEQKIPILNLVPSKIMFKK